MSDNAPLAPAYLPNPACNVQWFMEAHGVSSMSDLRKQSVSDPDWFWSSVVEYLEIPFHKPFTRLINDDKGIAATTWFEGGELNIVEACVDRHVKTRADARAVYWQGDDGQEVTWTYQELQHQVNGVARWLRNHGVGKGDVVAIYMPMIPEIVAAVLGVAKIGAIFLPLFSGYGVEAIETRIHDAEAKVILTVDGFWRRGKRVETIPIINEVQSRCGSLRTACVVPRFGDVALGESAHPWPEPVDEEATEYVESEHPLFIAYTSGTTGKPKGVVHVHGGFLVKIAEEAAFQTDARCDDTLFWFTDMGWIMGPWEVVGGLSAGACVALFEGAPDYPHPGRLWEFCEQGKVTILGASPTLIRSLMVHGESFVNQYDLASLRILASTGEPWNEDPWWWYFRVVGGSRCPIINLSGGTEVGACFLSPHPNEEIFPMSLGGPSLGMAVDVFNDEGKPLRDAVGELVCTQPWPGMTRGLWKAPERFIETYFSRWQNVWVHGDWASIDHGIWYLHGRSDDTIKVAGKRLGPAEAESAAVSHPEVVEAAAIGFPDAHKGEVLWIYVVVASTAVMPKDQLKNEVSEVVAAQLGKSFRPTEVRITNALPKTRNGKVLRRTIRAVACGQDPGDMSSIEDATTLNAIKEAQ